MAGARDTPDGEADVVKKSRQPDFWQQNKRTSSAVGKNRVIRTDLLPFFFGIEEISQAIFPIQ